MPRFVALLRGVNVGKGNRLPMAEFKALLQQLEYTDVSTLLNSGNAVFSSTGKSSAKHAASIARALEKRLALRVATVVKSAVELSAIVAANPISVPDSDHSKFFVAFAQEPAALQGLQELQPIAQPPERLAIGEQAAYLHCANGVLESKVGAAMLGKLGKSLTTRNWATVLKLHTLCSASAA
jgi:uncharacterized protein (DUF1697 family)